MPDLDPATWRALVAVVAVLVAIERLRKVRDSVVAALWESEDHRKRDAAAITDHPLIKEMEGRVKALSRQCNPGESSDLHWEQHK